MEAALDGAFATAEEVVGEGGTARERVHRVSRYLFEATRVSEQGFRLFLAKALEASAQEGAPQLRGGRRLPMYVLALEPVRDRMTPEAFQAPCASPVGRDRPGSLARSQGCVPVG